MMLKELFEAELTSTIGPGSKNRWIPSNGYNLFRYARFIEGRESEPRGCAA